MTDYYLRAGTLAQLSESIGTLGIKTNGIDGEFHFVDGQRIDIGWLGQIVSVDETTGQVTNDSRFHANLRVSGELTDEQRAALPIINAPLTPYRTWA